MSVKRLKFAVEFNPAPIVRSLLTIIVSMMLALITTVGAYGQIVSPTPGVTLNTDSVRRDFDNRPYFGLYKDNYFIFGTAVGKKPTVENSNVKFQISFSQRVTNSTLPFNTYLYIFYTQKVFWNVLQKSLPMTDLNFNPGIGLAKPLFVKNRYIGKATLVIEHESNGKDGTASRSWNKVSLGANIIIDPSLMVHGKFWIPIIDGGENRDILSYSGIYQVGTEFVSSNNKYFASVVLTKRKGWNLNYNAIVEFGLKLTQNSNQYLFLQYYNGYGEGLFEYNKFHSQVRVGICIKPALFSDY